MPDEQPPNQQKPRPHAHLTVDELRAHEHVTDEEWFDELRARGILVPACDPDEPLRPIAHRPGALARFLKERG